MPDDLEPCRICGFRFAACASHVHITTGPDLTSRYWSDQDYIASQGSCPNCNALYGNSHEARCGLEPNGIYVHYTGIVSLDPGWGPD